MTEKLFKQPAREIPEGYSHHDVHDDPSWLEQPTIEIDVYHVIEHANWKEGWAYFDGMGRPVFLFNDVWVW